jgi:hypothetical protein
MKTQAWCCYSAGLLLLCGCAGSEPSISGTVKLDSEPLAEGAVRFIPIEGTSGPDAGAEIKDGKYRVVQPGLAPGRYRVEFSSHKPTGKRVRDPLGGGLAQETVQLVPQQYRGENSTLRRDITQGANTKDFELVTTGAGK